MHRAEFRPARDRPVGGIGALENVLGHQGYDRIDLRVHGFDAIQVGLDDLPRSYPLGSDQFRKRGGIQVV